MRPRPLQRLRSLLPSPPFNLPACSSHLAPCDLPSCLPLPLHPRPVVAVVVAVVVVVVVEEVVVVVVELVVMVGWIVVVVKECFHLT